MKMENERTFIQKYAWAIISFLLLVSIAGVINKNNGAQNLYTYQAEAFLKGNFAIQGSQNKLPGEIIENKGEIYVPFPPLPAILLTPFVAVFGGEKIKIYWITITLAFITCFVLNKILLKLAIGEKLIPWIIAGFALGTAYWQILQASVWVWMFAQITFMLFALLSINETLHAGRGIIAGLFLGMAFLSRQMSIYLIFFIAVLLWKNPKKTNKAINILWLLCGFGICLIFYLFFNYYRFGSFGSGYENINSDVFGGPENFGWARIKQYGIFSASYIPFNAIYMFLQGFHLEFGGADMLQITAVDPFGTSLLSASPFVIAIFRAKWDREILWGAWLSMGLCLMHILFYHNNGYIQFNAQRFSLDFMPVLIILIAYGFKNSSADLLAVLKGMVLYSVLLNIIIIILLGDITKIV